MALRRAIDRRRRAVMGSLRQGAKRGPTLTAGLACLTALCALLGLTHVTRGESARTQCVLAPLALRPALRVLGARYIALSRNTLEADERFWVTTWLGFGFGLGLGFGFGLGLGLGLG